MGQPQPKPPIDPIEPEPTPIPPEETPLPRGFSISQDRYDAFRTKDANGKYPYKSFESDLNDAKTLEYKIPDLIESNNTKTQKVLADIEKYTRSDISKRNAKYTKDISDKEDKDADEIEAIMSEIDENKRLLKEEMARSNGAQSPEVILINGRLSDLNAKLKSTQRRHKVEMEDITFFFNSDISLIDDIKRDDIRKAKISKKMYEKKLVDKLKSAIDDINDKYPTELLKMEPKIEVEDVKGECTIVLTQDTLDFIKNKWIKCEPKPVLSRKFGLRFEDEEYDDDTFEKDVARMQRLTDLLEERYAEDKERREKEKQQAAFNEMFNTNLNPTTDV